jgi:hypothetical protein
MVRNIAEDANIILSLKSFCECCGMQLRTTLMISAYKRIPRERLITVGKKAAGRNNTPGSGSRIEGIAAACEPLPYE